MRVKEREAFERALSMARASVVDPRIASENAGSILSLLSVVAPSVLGAPIPTRIVVPNSNPNITHDTTTPVATDPIVIEWPRNGRLVGIVGTVAQGAEYRTKIGVQLQIAGEPSLITSGTSAAYASLANLSNAEDGFNHRYLRFEKPVRKGDKWTITYKILEPARASGSAVYTPLVNLLFESDDE